MDFLSSWVESVTPFMHVEDPLDLKVPMATYWANHLPGPQVWLVLRGKSGIGGSRILSLFSKFPDALYIPEFTHAGFERMLKKIDESYAKDMPVTHLFINDLTYILTEEPKVLHDLRLAYGVEYGRQMDKKALHKQQHGFGLIAKGTNNSLDLAHDWTAKLGQRFLEWRLAEPIKAVIRPFTDDEDKEQAAQVTFDKIRELAEEKYHELFREEVSRIDFSYQDELHNIIDFMRHGRAFVARDEYDKEIGSPVDPEHWNRPTGQLEKLVRSLAVLSGHSEVEQEDMKVAKKIAIDSIPSWRHRVLLTLHQSNGEMQLPHLRSIFGLSAIGPYKRTFDNILAELKLLGMIEWEEGDKVAVLASKWEETLTLWEKEIPASVKVPTVSPYLLKMWRGEVDQQDLRTEMADAMERADVERLERLVPEDQQPVDVEYDEYGRPHLKKPKEK